MSLTSEFSIPGKIRLLLVDDQSLVRQGLQALLSLEPDFEIAGLADNGETAIEQVKALQPDVVLMDLRMPVMNGASATRFLSQQFPNIKVLVLSTDDAAQEVATAIQAGAKGYLLKDMPSEELAAAIRSIHRGYTQFAPGLLEKIAARSFAPPMRPEFSQLTARELEVAQRVAVGATNQEIAQQLFISESTVKTHINSIFNRLNLKNRSQLASLMNACLPSVYL